MSKIFSAQLQIYFSSINSSLWVKELWLLLASLFLHWRNNNNNHTGRKPLRKRWWDTSSSLRDACRVRNADTIDVVLYLLLPRVCSHYNYHSLTPWCKTNTCIKQNFNCNFYLNVLKLQRLMTDYLIITSCLCKFIFKQVHTQPIIKAIISLRMWWITHHPLLLYMNLQAHKLTHCPCLSQCSSSATLDHSEWRPAALEPMAESQPLSEAASCWGQ